VVGGGGVLRAVPQLRVQGEEALLKLEY